MPKQTEAENTITLDGSKFTDVLTGENVSYLVDDGFLYLRVDVDRPIESMDLTSSDKNLRVATIGRAIDVGGGIKAQMNVWTPNKAYEEVKKFVLDNSKATYKDLADMSYEELVQAKEQIGEGGEQKKRSWR